MEDIWQALKEQLHSSNVQVVINFNYQDKPVCPKNKKRNVFGSISKNSRDLSINSQNQGSKVSKDPTHGKEEGKQAYSTRWKHMQVALTRDLDVNHHLKPILQMVQSSTERNSNSSRAGLSVVIDKYCTDSEGQKLSQFYVIDNPGYESNTNDDSFLVNQRCVSNGRQST